MQHYVAGSLIPGSLYPVIRAAMLVGNCQKPDFLIPHVTSDIYQPHTARRTDPHPQPRQIAKAIAASGVGLEGLALGYVELATLVEPLPTPSTIFADPDGDHVLACALVAEAELIVSGDKHLLGLGAFKGIKSSLRYKRWNG